MTARSRAGLAALAALIIAFAGCGSAPDEGDTRAESGTGAESGAAAAPVSLDDLIPRDTNGMDVCAELGGEAVATALAMPLDRVERGADGRMCSYYLSREARSEARVDVVLETGASFLFTRNSSENAEPIAGLGVAAFSRKATGVTQQIWVARQDGLYYQVSAYENGMAEPVARAALTAIR